MILVSGIKFPLNSLSWNLIGLALNYLNPGIADVGLEEYTINNPALSSLIPSKRPLIVRKSEIVYSENGQIKFLVFLPRSQRTFSQLRIKLDVEGDEGDILDTIPLNGNSFQGGEIFMKNSRNNMFFKLVYDRHVR